MLASIIVIADCAEITQLQTSAHRPEGSDGLGLGGDAPAADRDGVPDPGGVEVPSAARAAEDGVKDDVRRRPELDGAHVADLLHHRARDGVGGQVDQRGGALEDAAAGGTGPCNLGGVVPQLEPNAIASSRVCRYKCRLWEAPQLCPVET